MRADRPLAFVASQNGEEPQRRLSWASASIATNGLLFTIIGMAMMMLSLWLLPLGGMASKILILLFWGPAVLLAVPRWRPGPDQILAMLVLFGLCGWVLIGPGDVWSEIRLIGNLVILPLGLVAGRVFGGACRLVMIVPLTLFLLFDTHFYFTFEGWRLSNPFLFLALLMMLPDRPLAFPTSSGQRIATVGLAIAAMTGVMLSQTRIAVLAMAILLSVRVRYRRAITWLWALPVLAGGLWAVGDLLPRLLSLQGSGRLAYWQMFWDHWWQADPAQRWIGFGAGSVGNWLSSLPGAASFGALHNDHFHILYETGIIGAGVWLAGWGMMIWLVRRSKQAVAVLLAVAVTMVTDNTLSYGHFLLAGGLAAGMASRMALHGDVDHG